MPTEPQSVSDTRRERWLEQIKNGKTRKQIADENHISRQRVTQIIGPIESPGKREEIHIYAVRELFEGAADIAAERGLRHKAGKTAGQGSVGLLVEQIALGNITLSDTERVDDDSPGHVPEDSASE
jgi:DNA-binding CsgD family transcriptional regulator